MILSMTARGRWAESRALAGILFRVVSRSKVLAPQNLLSYW